MAVEQNEDYLERRYEAASERVGRPDKSYLDRITCFMIGAKWERETREGKPLTVGDLSASMIGNAVVRVEHEGGAVEGTLLDIDIDAEVHNIPRGDEQYRPRVVRLLVSLRIGSFTIDGLPPEHPVEIVR